MTRRAKPIQPIRVSVDADGNRFYHYRKARLKKGWRREGTTLISPSGVREADLSQVRTVPVMQRTQGWSAHVGGKGGKSSPTPPPLAHLADPRSGDLRYDAIDD
jgi:hypothetical protein